MLFQGGSLVGQILYRTLFLAVSITYGLSLYHRFGGARPSFYVLLRMENFQYGFLGFLWLVSRWHWIKIVPYFGYSLLQASNYYATEVKPDSPISKQIEDLRTKHIAQFSEMLAHANLLVMLRIILEVITLRPGSTVAVLAYSFFLRIRFAYSGEQKKSFTTVKKTVDNLIDNPKTPAKIKDVYTKICTQLGTMDHYELDPKISREKAAKRKQQLAADREAANKAAENFQTEVSKSGFDL